MIKVTKRIRVYEVYCTPEDGIGGEFPQPARRTRRKKVAEAYAAACRDKLKQKTRIAVKMMEPKLAPRE